jgi:VWFA-related protein
MMMKRRQNYFRYLSLVLLLTFAWTTFAPAQSGRQQTPPDQNQKKNKRPDPSTKPDEPPVPPDLGKDPDDIVRVVTSLINIETVVYHKKSGQIVTGLKKENFTILEDGQPKEITFFSTPEAPITVTMVIDYSKLTAAFGYLGNNGQEPGQYEVLRPAAEFLSRFVKPPDDYVSVIAYDLRPTPITDFTNDPRRIQQVITLLARNQPAFSDSNLFDAMKLTLIGGKADSVVLEESKSRTTEYSGMASLKGRRKAAIIIGSGIDTFSKINFDTTRKIVQEAGVPLYFIGTGELFIKKFGDDLDPSRVMPGTPDRLTFYQAKNQLSTFAKESGGAYYPVTFAGEIRGVLQSINAMLRSQYSLGFTPTRDGKAHKLTVRVDVNGDGQTDEKEFVVQARTVYTVPKDK